MFAGACIPTPSPLIYISVEKLGIEKKLFTTKSTAISRHVSQTDLHSRDISRHAKNGFNINYGIQIMLDHTFSSLTLYYCYEQRHPKLKWIDGLKSAFKIVADNSCGLTTDISYLLWRLSSKEVQKNEHNDPYYHELFQASTSSKVHAGTFRKWHMMLFLIYSQEYNLESTQRAALACVLDQKLMDSMLYRNNQGEPMFFGWFLYQSIFQSVPGYITTIMSSSGFLEKFGTVASLLGYPTGSSRSNFSFGGRSTRGKNSITHAIDLLIHSSIFLKMSCCPVPTCIPTCSSPICYPVGGLGSLSSCGLGSYGMGSSAGGSMAAASLAIAPGASVSCVNQTPPSELLVQPSPFTVVLPGAILAATSEPVRVGGYTACASGSSGWLCCFQPPSQIQSPPGWNEKSQNFPARGIMKYPNARQNEKEVVLLPVEVVAEERKEAGRRQRGGGAVAVAGLEYPPQALPKYGTSMGAAAAAAKQKEVGRGSGPGCLHLLPFNLLPVEAGRGGGGAATMVLFTGGRQIVGRAGRAPCGGLASQSSPGMLEGS
ncbi:hypothetical protein E2320_019083 [Naja naja]|nr:hypothetical protein E2320_019083 [Naja naja]